MIILILNFTEICHCIILSPSIKSADNSDKIKIGLINILTSNNHFETVRNELLRNDSEILVVEEIDTKWSDELNPVKIKYPYKYEYIREDNFGIAVYSKFPVKNFNTIIAGIFEEIPVLSALIEKDGKIVEVIAIHTTPPARSSYFKNTKKMLEDISRYITTRNIPTIVIGDINSSRFSYNYKNFIKKTKMKDAGNIFQLTWPTYWILPARIPLDHIFVTHDIKVYNFKKGNNVGSDHFPVYAEIGL